MKAVKAIALLGLGLTANATVHDNSFVNVGGLIENGFQTVGDVTNAIHGQANITSLINDGINIVGDFTANNNFGILSSLEGAVDSITGKKEESSSSSDSSDDADQYGPGTIGVVFVNVDGLIENGIQAVGDVTNAVNGKANVGSLIQDGLNIVGDLTTTADNNFGILSSLEGAVDSITGKKEQSSSTDSSDSSDDADQYGPGTIGVVFVDVNGMADNNFGILSSIEGAVDSITGKKEESSSTDSSDDADQYGPGTIGVVFVDVDGLKAEKGFLGL